MICVHRSGNFDAGYERRHELQDRHLSIGIVQGDTLQISGGRALRLHGSLRTYLGPQPQLRLAPNQLLVIRVVQMPVQNLLSVGQGSAEPDCQPL